MTLSNSINKMVIIIFDINNSLSPVSFNAMWSHVSSNLQIIGEAFILNAETRHQLGRYFFFKKQLDQKWPRPAVMERLFTWVCRTRHDQSPAVWWSGKGKRDELADKVG